MLPPLQPLTKPIPCTPVAPITLDFEALAPFDRLQDQYQDLGIRFEDAIAIHPSHPGFKPPSGSIALMPSGGASVTVHFDRSIAEAGATVVGARQVRLTAFDRHSNVLAQDRTRTPLKIAAESIKSFPQQTLKVVGDRIARIVFTSDAPFILDDFFCA